MISGLRRTGLSPLSAARPAPLLYATTLESTMTTAATLLRDGFPHGTALRAGYQSAGRGRGEGRRWLARPDENLLTTLILRQLPPSTAPESLPLRVGLAAALLFEESLLAAHRPETADAVRIKWPNDLLVDNAKAGGILCEMRGTSFLVGIGLNINQAHFEEGRESRFRFPPTSLALQTADYTDWSVTLLWERLLGHLSVTLGYAAVPGRVFPWREELERRLWRRGEQVAFAPGGAGTDERCRGELVGVDERGALVIREEGGGGERAFYAGEIVE